MSFARILLGMGGMEDLIARWLSVLPGLWLGLCVHEAAHGWAALLRGDASAREAGRLTLYPPRHLDWLGSVLLPMLMLAVFRGFVFGWARPTPVDPGRLRSPKRDFSLVALAGPLSNLGLAASLALAFRFWPGEWPAWAAAALGWAILANVLLGCFNLLPLPGLDGIKAAYAFLPESWCWRLNRSEPWMLLVPLLLAYAGALNWVFWPVAWLTGQLCDAAGIPFPVG